MTPGPQGHQAAPITRASGRSSPAVRSARLGAEGAAASGWALRRPRLGPAGHRHPPNPSTCTARLRKVPASAANFFTLKSMMFILGGSRAELPADLAGRRRRLGRAGAPGGSGGGRRGRWREAAPAPPPQLSFPSGGGERAGRGERTHASEPDGRRRRRRRGSRGRACPVPRVAANVPLAAGSEQKTNRLAF